MDFSANKLADDHFHFYDQSLVTDIQGDSEVKLEIQCMFMALPGNSRLEVRPLVSLVTRLFREQQMILRTMIFI